MKLKSYSAPDYLNDIKLTYSEGAPGKSGQIHVFVQKQVKSFKYNHEVFDKSFLIEFVHRKLRNQRNDIKYKLTVLLPRERSIKRRIEGFIFIEKLTKEAEVLEGYFKAIQNSQVNYTFAR